MNAFITLLLIFGPIALAGVFTVGFKFAQDGWEDNIIDSTIALIILVLATSIAIFGVIEISDAVQFLIDSGYGQ